MGAISTSGTQLPPDGPPDRTRRRIIGGRFVTVKLGNVERRGNCDLLHVRARFVDEDPDPALSHARFDTRGDFRRKISRALRIEVEPDGIGAACDRGRGVFLVGDAADLEDHAPTSLPSAAAGSPDFIRCSPTRNAWYPAARSVAMSCAL